MTPALPSAGAKFRRHKKLWITLLVIAVVLLIAGLVPFDLPVVRSSFESALRKTGADSVHVGHASVSLWRGIALDSVFFSRPDPHGGRFQAGIPLLRVSIRILPLLLRHVAFESITIKNPDFTIIQKRAVVAPIPSAPLNLDTLLNAFANLPFTFSIQSMSMKSGSVTVRKDRTPVMQAQDIDLTFQFRKIFDAQGTAAVKKMIFSHKWEFTDLSIRFRSERALFVLDEVSAGFYGGRFNASAAVDLSRSRLEKGAVHLKGLDLRRMYAATGNPGDVSGKTDFDLTLEKGRLAPNSLAGHGRFSAKDVNARNLPLQQKLLLLLLAPDLANMHFAHICSDFTLRNGRVNTPNIEGKGEPLSFASSGWIDLNSSLSQQTTILLEPSLAKGLPPQVRNVMAQAPDGRFYFGCDISGTFDEPRVMLQRKFQERAVEEILRNVGNGIMQFLGN